MSVWASDDLASVIIRPDLEFAGWGQGVIEAWNPETFENVVQYRGSEHVNLPVASGVEALTYQPGDVVMLSRWQPTGGGATTLRIGAGGRVIVPGTGAAEKAISWMTTALASRVARAVIGQSFVADSSGGGFVNTGTWGDGLLGVGPVCQVDISELGLAIVWISCEFGNLNFDALSGGAGFAHMSVEITGATTRAPGFLNGVPEASLGNQREEVPMSTTCTVTSMRLVSGLNPGPHTFTCRYMRSFDVISWSARNPTMVVLPF